MPKVTQLIGNKASFKSGNYRAFALEAILNYIILMLPVDKNLTCISITPQRLEDHLPLKIIYV